MIEAKIDSGWFIVEDGRKRSYLMYGVRQAHEYIIEQDLSPTAVIYWGHLKPSTRPHHHKSEKVFCSDGACFVQNWLSEVFNF